VKRDNLKDALKKALDMEEEGHDFYVKTAKKTTNPLGKATFTALAEDEIDHIKAIKAFYAHICGQKSVCLNIKELIQEHAAMHKKSVFKKAMKDFKDKIDVATDDIKAYKFAMDIENNGLKVYKHMLDTAGGDKELEEMLKFLIGEESTHYNLLQSTYEYLSDPGAWFLKEEKPIVEGG